MAWLLRKSEFKNFLTAARLLTTRNRSTLIRTRVVHGSSRPVGRVGSGLVEILENSAGRVEVFENFGFFSGFFGGFARVGSVSYRGSAGRVGSGIWWVWSALEKWTRGQL
jgi:hypothetical protein